MSYGSGRLRDHRGRGAALLRLVLLKVHLDEPVVHHGLGRAQGQQRLGVARELNERLFVRGIQLKQEAKAGE
jgi:hypothetical protein